MWREKLASLFVVVVAVAVVIVLLLLLLLLVLRRPLMPVMTFTCGFSLVTTINRKNIVTAHKQPSRSLALSSNDLISPSQVITIAKKRKTTKRRRTASSIPFTLILDLLNSLFSSFLCALLSMLYKFDHQHIQFLCPLPDWFVPIPLNEE